jgi:hypothetical protein
MERSTPKTRWKPLEPAHYILSWKSYFYFRLASQFCISSISLHDARLHLAEYIKNGMPDPENPMKAVGIGPLSCTIEKLRLLIRFGSNFRKVTSSAQLIGTSQMVSKYISTCTFIYWNFVISFTISWYNPVWSVWGNSYLVYPRTQVTVLVNSYSWTGNYQTKVKVKTRWLSNLFQCTYYTW